MGAPFFQNMKNEFKSFSTVYDMPIFNEIRVVIYRCKVLELCFSKNVVLGRTAPLLENLRYVPQCNGALKFPFERILKEYTLAHFFGVANQVSGNLGIYSLCQKKCTFNSEFFCCPQVGEGGQKFTW